MVLIRSSRAKLSKASKERLPDTALTLGTGYVQDCGTDSTEGFARSAPRETLRREIDTTPGLDPVIAKRALSISTDKQRPEGGDVKQQTDEVHQHLQTPLTGVPEKPDIQHSSPKLVGQAVNDSYDAAVEPSSRNQTRVVSKRFQLTRRNLRLLDMMSKSAKEGLATETVNSRSTSRGNIKITKSDRTTATATSGFLLQATANGILRPLRSIPPNNAKEILDYLNRRRDTAPPPESQYQGYRERIKAAGNEATVVDLTRRLFKEYDDQYQHDLNRAFTAVPEDVGFNDGLPAPQPDFVQGLPMEEFLPVDPSKINGAVLFKDDVMSTTLPHLAGEWKFRTGNMEEATLQSGYDGAALVYGRNQAREHLGKPEPPGHSAVTTFTSNGEQITFFAHHASPTGPNGETQYHQHQLVQTNLTESYESFKRGRNQIRNAQDYAREQSLALRDELRKQWEAQQGGAGSLKRKAQCLAAVQVEVDGDDGDADDNAAFEAIIKKAYQPTPRPCFKRQRRLN